MRAKDVSLLLSFAAIGVGFVLWLATPWFISAGAETTASKGLVIVGTKLTPAMLADEMSKTRRELAEAKLRLKEMDKSRSWGGWGSLPPSLAEKYAEVEATKIQLEAALVALEERREAQLVQIRATTPIFSALAVQEASELFKSRQEEHSAVSRQLVWWDILLDFERYESFGEWLAVTVLKVIYRFCLGAVAALFDFAISLALRLRQYELYYPVPVQPDVTGGAASTTADDITAAAATLCNTGNVEADEACRRERQLSASSSARTAEFDFLEPVPRADGFVHAFAFWALAMCAGLAATVVTIVMYCSPVIAIYGCFWGYERYQRWRQQTWHLD